MSYSCGMAKLFCPRCGAVAQGGNGFWGRTKPYCASCGWNVERAKDVERAGLKDLRWAVLLFAAFCAVVAFVARDGSVIVPFAFLGIFGIAWAITSWKKLKALETLPTNKTDSPTSDGAIGDSRRNAPSRPLNSEFQVFQVLPRPRPVRLKAMAKTVYLAFPISIIAFAYFGYRAVGDGLSDAVKTSDLVPLVIVAVVWSAIAVFLIRRARRDRRLLEQGELAMALIINQDISGGKNRRSRVTYSFRSTAGKDFQCEATDDSWTLYEEMQTPVFYNPENPEENVLMVNALCALEVS